jgi:GGDEF domain-containing protein
MKSIVIICQDIILNNAIERSTKGIYQSVIFNKMSSALDYIYNSIPHLIVINITNDDPMAVNKINDIKADPLFYQLPVMAILPDQFNPDRLDTLVFEDYIWRADFERDFLARVNLSILRSEKIVEINPLTRLPGNISIGRQIQERLEQNRDFAFGYADLDYFKAFNDHYGFSRGDEVIKMTGRLCDGQTATGQFCGSYRRR